MTIRSSAHVGVDEGATVTRIYWAVPTAYSPGDEYPSRTEALEAAIATTKHAVTTSVYVPERVTFDERWTFANPKGGGIDLVIQRTTYETIAEAERMLVLAKKYGKGVPA